MATFDDFIAGLEAEARAEGSDAVAELQAFRLHFSLARQLAAQQIAERRAAEKESFERITTLKSEVDLERNAVLQAKYVAEKKEKEYSSKRTHRLTQRRRLN